MALNARTKGNDLEHQFIKNKNSKCQLRNENNGFERQSEKKEKGKNNKWFWTPNRKKQIWQCLKFLWRLTLESGSKCQI